MRLAALLTSLRARVQGAPRATRGAALALIAMMAALLALDHFVAAGYEVSWFVTHEGQRSEMRRTEEHRVTFPNERRALSRYMQGWDFRRYGMPAALPAIDATLRATLVVPEGPGHFVHTDSSGDVALRIDGEPLQGRVAPGPHALEVDWRSPTDGAHFALTWGEIDESPEEVPHSAILFDRPSQTRRLLWLIGLPLALIFAALIFASLESGAHQRRARHWLATLTILFLALLFRLSDYDVMPDFRENEDELFAMWNGFSLLQDGTARGWSLWWPAYLTEPNVGEVYQAHYFYRTFDLVTPYFEHPPLLHLLVGAMGHLAGAQGYLEVTLGQARIVPIALSVVTLLLMMAIGRRLYPRSTAPYWGALFYAILPWVVLQTRVVKEEALVTPLALGAILAFLKWRDEGRSVRLLILAAFLASVTVLAKITGLAFAIALCILVAKVGSQTANQTANQTAGQRMTGHQNVALVVGVSALSVLALCLYGYALGWDAFRFASHMQTLRHINFNVFLRFFDEPRINHSSIGRGWSLFLWLAAAKTLFSKSERESATLAIPLFVYLMAIAVGSGTWHFGWYTMPLLPFVCLAAGRFMEELYRSPDLAKGAFFTITLVFYSLSVVISHSYFTGPDPTVQRLLVSGVLIAFIAPYTLAHAYRMRGLGQFATVAGMLTVLITSAVLVFGYDIYYAALEDTDQHERGDR
jgi:4-amino-4-deoxy-L-arabinose transferase-like glycosyltransferase